MPKPTQVTPFFFVQELDEGCVLGRRGWLQTLGSLRRLAYLHRDGAGIRLLRGAPGPASAAYFDVEDATPFGVEFRSRPGAELRNNPEGPRDQTYGQREFTVFAPGNHKLFFGQESFRNEPAPDALLAHCGVRRATGSR